MTSTYSAVGLTVLRVVLGVIFIAHGAQKLFGMGFGGVAGMFGDLGIPFAGLAGVLVTLLELFGGIALVLGLFTRPVAALLSVVMLTALLVVHLPGGFFATEGGIELPLMLMASCLALVLSGPGTAALDGLLGSRRRSETVRGPA